MGRTAAGLPKGTAPCAVSGKAQICSCCQSSAHPSTPTVEPGLVRDRLAHRHVPTRPCPELHQLPTTFLLNRHRYLSKDILLSVFHSVYSGHWMRWQLRSREAGDEPPPSREGQECMLTAGGHARGLWKARTHVRPQAMRSPGCRWGAHSSQPSQDLTHGA